jgi:Zn-dependent peptidase ImmA (M78 family)
VKVPYLSRSGIAQAASSLLERGLGASADSLPVNLDALVFDHLCEHEGLVFVDDEALTGLGADEILGRTELIAGRITVCADLKERDRRRYRFTVAHELGHWVLHRPLALVEREHPELFPQEQIYTTTQNTLTGVGASVAPEEWQANYFASHLLIPRAGLRREFLARHGSEVSLAPPGVSLRDHSRNLARLNVRSLGSVADAFETSIEATAIAIEDAGLAVLEPLLL